MSKKRYFVSENDKEKTLDKLKDVLANIQDQIKFADAKAGFLITLLSIVIGFVFSKYSEFLPLLNNTFFLIFFFLFSGLILYSLISCFRVIFSRLGGNTPQTKVFFAHINKEYKFDYQRYSSDVQEASVNDWIQDFSAQILEVSDIATIKHKIFRNGVRASTVALITSFIIMGIFLCQKTSPSIEKPEVKAKEPRSQKKSIPQLKPAPKK